MGEARWVAQGARGARGVRRERRGGRPRGRGEGEYEGVDTVERAKPACTERHRDVNREHELLLAKRFNGARGGSGVQ